MRNASLTVIDNSLADDAAALVDRSLCTKVVRGDALLCRLAGHAPRVESAGELRWIQCRCAARPVPALRFDPDTPPDEVSRLLLVARDCEWSPRRAEVCLQLVVGRRAQSFAVAVTAEGPGGEHDIGVHVGVPGIAAYVRAVGYGTRLTSRMPLGAERVFRVDVGPRGVWWSLWTQTGGPHARWRSGIRSWADVAFGAVRRAEREVDRRECAIPMPEGVYRAVARLVEEQSSRVGPLGRFLPSRRRLLAEVNAADDGVPVPGRGDSAWDCGDTAVLGCANRVARHDDCGQWVAAGVAAMVRTVLEARARHGGPNWAPAQR